MLAESACRVFAVNLRGRTIHLPDTPLLRQAVSEFTNGCEEATLDFFDAVLPRCDRMIDCGAYVGLTSLYASGAVGVDAFEASPTHLELLRANLACNPAARVRVHGVALGDHDGEVALFRKAHADSGTSIFRDVQRGTVLRGRQEAVVPMRDAAAALGELHVTSRTLLKIDIEGAEYQVIAALAPLLAARKPFLHVSFHPFNLVVSDDEYRNALTRLRHALAVAEALAAYRYIHLCTPRGWICVEASARMEFLQRYLLTPKPAPRISVPQFGFLDGVGFSDTELALG